MGRAGPRGEHGHGKRRVLMWTWWKLSWQLGLKAQSRRQCWCQGGLWVGTCGSCSFGDLAACKKIKVFTDLTKTHLSPAALTECSWSGDGRSLCCGAFSLVNIIEIKNFNLFKKRASHGLIQAASHRKSRAHCGGAHISFPEGLDRSAENKTQLWGARSCFLEVETCEGSRAAQAVGEPWGRQLCPAPHAPRGAQPRHQQVAQHRGRSTAAFPAQGSAPSRREQSYRQNKRSELPRASFQSYTPAQSRCFHQNVASRCTFRKWKSHPPAARAVRGRREGDARLRAAVLKLSQGELHVAGSEWHLQQCVNKPKPGLLRAEIPLGERSGSFCHSQAPSSVQT